MTNVPILFNGKPLGTADLLNSAGFYLPGTLATVATTGNYTDLASKPPFTVAGSTTTLTGAYAVTGASALQAITGTTLYLSSGCEVGFLNLRGSQVINLGSDQSKASSAGYLGYQTLTSGAVDLVGAGTAVGSRTIKLWDNVTVPGTLTVAGAASAGGLSSTGLVVNAPQSAGTGAISIINPSLGVNSVHSLTMGQGSTNYNLAQLTFNYAASGSTSNNMTLGLYGFSQPLQIYANQVAVNAPLSVTGNATVGGTLAVTGSMTGGSLVVPGTSRLTGQLIVGDTVEQNSIRAMTCLYNMGTSSAKYITLGQSATSLNSAELCFYYSGSGSTSNYVSLGMNALTGLQVFGSGLVQVNNGLSMTGLTSWPTPGATSGLTWGSGPYSKIVDDGDLRICTDDNMHFFCGLTSSSNGTEVMTLTTSAVTHRINTCITGSNVINLGSDVTKETSAGRIGYQTFTAGALDIVGAGTATPRTIKLWDNVTVNGNVTAGPGTLGPMICMYWGSSTVAAGSALSLGGSEPGNPSQYGANFTGGLAPRSTGGDTITWNRLRFIFRAVNPNMGPSTSGAATNNQFQLVEQNFNYGGTNNGAQFGGNDSATYRGYVTYVSPFVSLISTDVPWYQIKVVSSTSVLFGPVYCQFST